MGGGVGKSKYKVQLRRSVDSAGQFPQKNLAAWVADRLSGDRESHEPAFWRPKNSPSSIPRSARGGEAAGAATDATASASTTPSGGVTQCPSLTCSLNTVGPTLLRDGREGSKSHEGNKSREQDRSAARAMSCDRSKDTSKDGRWHQKHCSDKMLVFANTIQQAYPFDPYSQKTVEKKEHLSSIGDRRLGFGEVTVTKTGPRKLHCRTCARLLVDVDDDDHREGPFYFCRKCHEMGRRYHICTACWQDLKSAVVAVNPFDVHAGLAPPNRSDQRCRTDPTGAAGSEAALGVSPATVPPGLWKGSITESGYKRDASLNLTFSWQGEITGSGPTREDEVTVSGVWRRDGLTIMVVWSEGHAWGKTRVDGQFTVSEDTAKITARMIASDGGEASLVLSRRL